MVLENIDHENRDLQNIFNKTILRDNWLTPFEKEKCPGTVKSYLASLNQFYIFAKCEKPEGVAATEEQWSRLSTLVKLWNEFPETYERSILEEENGRLGQFKETRTD